jgi:hypothetical protein
MTVYGLPFTAVVSCSATGTPSYGLATERGSNESIGERSTLNGQRMSSWIDRLYWERQLGR